MDICQSVMASFFVRAALGQYELEQPEHLLKLLATMARNKLANQANRHQAKCRDHRRIESIDAEERDVVAQEATPFRQTAARELLQEARRRLTPQEQQLLELREQGREWADIATELNGSAEALRKRYTRAIERVAQQLGLDELD
jgi:RNA polymerase sigma-70 factor (ECF subfamily)